jgi:ferric-dicitrate binding protein FerR (iron transport regulator)
MQSKITDFQFAQIETNTDILKPTLVLPDGSGIELESSSTINYQQDSSLVVDNKLIRESKTPEWKTTLNQLVIPFGNRSKVTLEDGTKVFLNAGSRFIYPSKFTGKEREVLLFGEAFFEVQKNPEMPFIVKTSSIQVKVLGTQFNISSYPEANIVQTVLVEGSVLVRNKNRGLFDEVELEPNQLLSFNKETNKYKSSVVNTRLYTSWKDGVIVFEDEDFGRLIKRVEHFYDIKIKFHNPVKSTVRVSGKLNLEEDKETVFKYLEILTKMKIEKIYEKNYVIK